MTTYCANCVHLRRVIHNQDSEMELLNNTIQDLRNKLRVAERKSKFPITAGKGIPDDILSAMIRLCHPDRNGGSSMSNEATSWLLRQRDLQKKRGK